MTKKKVEEWELNWTKKLNESKQALEASLQSKKISDLMHMIQHTGKLFGKPLSEIHLLAHETLGFLEEENEHLTIQQNGNCEDFLYKGYRFLRLDISGMYFDRMKSGGMFKTKEELEMELEKNLSSEAKLENKIEFLTEILQNPGLIKEDGFLEKYEQDGTETSDSPISILKKYVTKKLAYRTLVKASVQHNVEVELGNYQTQLTITKRTIEQLKKSLAVYEQEKMNRMEVEAFMTEFLEKYAIYSTESLFVYQKNK